jgi:hypothetical protein
MSDQDHKLKLFVVGERSGDPADWDELSSRAIVWAESEAQARDLTGHFSRPVSEVLPLRPSVLVATEVYT